MTGGAAERPRRVGRPRADRLRPASGRPPREELLCAAAELFTVRGYAATTTRTVAERAGMRQATRPVAAFAEATADAALRVAGVSGVAGAAGGVTT